MIYRMYLDPAKQKSDPGLAHRYSQFLLNQGLKKEKGINCTQDDLIVNPWGKPNLREHPDIYFNTSHCSGLVACAISDTPVGIDVEMIRAFNPYAANHACCAQELDAIYGAKDPNRMFFRHWTLKESCVKAMGTGLSYPIKQLVFYVSDREATCLNQPDYRFTLIEDAQQFVMAVCLKNHEAG